MSFDSICRYDSSSRIELNPVDAAINTWIRMLRKRRRWILTVATWASAFISDGLKKRGFLENLLSDINLTNPPPLKAVNHAASASLKEGIERGRERGNHT